MAEKSFIKYNNIEYVMPLLFNNDLFLFVLRELLREETNPIKYIYGTTKCAWSGGRPSLMEIQKLNTIENYLKRLPKYNVTPVFTFTNRNPDINDEFCNNLLDIAYGNNCQFIIASEVLYNHIKARYNNAKTVCSVIFPSVMYTKHGFNETEFYNKMLDKYDVVVVRPEWTIENIDFIDKVITDTSRIEVLINQTCAYNCPFQTRHYDLIADFETKKITEEQLTKEWHGFCPNFGEERDIPELFFNDEMISKLINQGVKLFKIQGRGQHFMQLYDTLYEIFFNKEEFSHDEILGRINFFCASLIQNNTLLPLCIL